MPAPRERRRLAALWWNCHPKTNSTGVARAQTTARQHGGVHVAEHGEVEDRQGQQGGADEVARLVAGLGAVALHHARRAALREGPGWPCSRGGPPPLPGRHVGAGEGLDAGLLPGEAHHRRRHPVLAGEDALDAQGARGAGHPLDVEDDGLGAGGHGALRPGRGRRSPRPSMAATIWCRVAGASKDESDGGGGHVDRGRGPLRAEGRRRLRWPSCSGGSGSRAPTG